ncbi:Na(+)-translocating NADH-quinone reductase subunit A [Roseibium sp. CAU 1637]|uniref:Na(+)-translocating NADH-quinone reductase subunit A n=1 Tax=Roseibium limicola TaxID=2816037 RepID=A0A939EK52_9HYPH|nr:Na(+)-translocating NADH-quinone reductase subunit A [Roseibium limicola]MBO0344081.1 Na(+)-translocating NADH-quinone reductase subunit A [Roseibium limicola]
MNVIRIKKGLDLPITGAPEQKIHKGRPVRSVGLLGADYVSLKPKMLVQEQDAVQRGAPLFCQKDDPEAVIVSPVTGRVRAINRGARRVLQSIVIDVEDAADKGIDFGTIAADASAADIADKLCAAGLWGAFRTRPYSKIPHHTSRPLAIYVNALDSEPLAGDPDLIISARKDDFEAGLSVVSRLTDGPTYLCQSESLQVNLGNASQVTQVGFTGPHPSGLAGTHLHFLTPPKGDTPVWTISYQDVLSIGALTRTGYLDPTKVIALSGPLASQPRLVETITGASTEDLIADEAEGTAPLRVVSGSVLSGRAAEGPNAYLGRYHRQITLIEEDKEQIPLGWIRPMPGKFAIQPVLGSAFSKKLYALTSNLNGGRRAMVPLGTFEELMPQDYLPTQLLRALLVKDTDTAQALGALELDEEDLGLIGFACPAKYEYGQALRECLEKIEKEG